MLCLTLKTVLSTTMHAQKDEHTAIRKMTSVRGSLGGPVSFTFIVSYQALVSKNGMITPVVFL